MKDYKMVVNNIFTKIVRSTHYTRFHEKEVPWSLVMKIIYTTKKKEKAKNIFEFSSKRFYVLCKKERDMLIVINAKRKNEKMS